MRMPLAGVRATWSAISWRLHARPMAQGQHDGADHGHQQHQAGRLEEVDVVGVEHPADRLGVGHTGRGQRAEGLRRRATAGDGGRDDDHLDGQDAGDGEADRQIAGEALPQARRSRRPASSPRTGTAPRRRRRRPPPAASPGTRRPAARTGPRRRRRRDQEQHRVHGIARRNHRQAPAASVAAASR